MNAAALAALRARWKDMPTGGSGRIHRRATVIVSDNDRIRVDVLSPHINLTIDVAEARGRSATATFTRQGQSADGPRNP